MCFNPEKIDETIFFNITIRVVTNREFWKTMKSFLTNKGCLDNCDIMLRGDNKTIKDDQRLAKLFNERYINIIEWSSGLKNSEKWINLVHFQTTSS